MRPAETFGALLAQRVRQDGGRPLVTYVGTDQRMELSAVSLANAVAKSAGLLRDDLDAQPGTPIALALPLHWQTAVWWGACAAVEGILVCPDAPADIGVATAANLSDIAGCAEQIAVSLAAFGLPDGAALPSTVVEAAVAARTHPDEFTPYTSPDPAVTLMDLGGQRLNVEQCREAARSWAEAWGVAPGGRLLITDNDWAPNEPWCWLALLAVPLVADASVVLASGISPGAIDQLRVDERITAVPTDSR